jgi:NADP-dependent 3-hydroxy acid dehydrogenase YdfG
MNILITGASSGIGAATAKKLSENGHLLLLASRSKEKLDGLNQRLGGQHVVAALDVCDYNALSSAVNDFSQKNGGLDVLVNNAGLGIFDPMVDGKIEDWHQMVDVNIKGLLNAIHCSLPLLKEAKGHLLNIGSVAAHHVFPNNGVYCATKHAVLAISESLRLELSSELRVTTISPGAVNTPFIDQTNNEDLLKNYKSYFAAGLDPMVIANQIAWAIEAPKEVVLSEIIVRPNKQTI